MKDCVEDGSLFEKKFSRFRKPIYNDSSPDIDERCHSSIVSCTQGFEDAAASFFETLSVVSSSPADCSTSSLEVSPRC